MLTESEQQALDQIRKYLAAGSELAAIRAAGWGNWIDYLEDKGIDLHTDEIIARTPQTTTGVGAEPFARISFYLRNAVLSLLRNRQRAMFAIGSVAVGVAAIVGLQLTADVLEDKLTTNVRELLRGDVVTEGVPPLGLGGGEGESFWATIQELQDEGLIDGFTRRTFIREDSRSFLANFKVVVQGRTDKDAVVNFYNPIFLETDVYPYYGRVQSEKPAGRDLGDLVQDPYDVVVTSTLANRHDINVDDEIKLGDIQDLFTVRGIMSDAEFSRECMPFVGCIIFRQDTMDSLFVAAPEPGGYVPERGQPDPAWPGQPEGGALLKVWPEEDIVWGAYGMEEGAELTLTIDDPSTAEPVDYSESQVASPTNWEPRGENYVSFDLWGVFDIQPGHRVSLSGPDITATHVVTNLAVTQVNADLDTVSGTADPSTRIEIEVHAEPGGGRDAFADSTGEWTVDFSVPAGPLDGGAAADILADTPYEVRQTDEYPPHATSVWRPGTPRAAPDADGQRGDDGRIILIEPPETQLHILAAGRSDAELEIIDQRLESSGIEKVTTAAEAAEDNKATVDIIRSVILVFGLVALAIGGLGIANTMQVLVRRRLPEAGVLKAIGLKGRQVMAVFLAEALIIGALGSVLGILIGVLVSFGTLRILEDLLFTDLAWRLGAGPVVSGLIVGLVVTLAFGLLPIVGAGRVRPMAAIRPNDSDLIKGSWPVSLMLLSGLALLAGIMVSVLIGSPWGLAGTLGAFAVVGVLLAILVAVIYVLSRLPAMGSLTLRLSLLEWRRHKTRAASTLLAMSIGVLGISLILLLADTMTNTVSTAYERSIGADVFVLVNDPEEEDDVFAMMREADGVTGFSSATVYDVVLVSHNGERFRDIGNEREGIEGFDYRDQQFLAEYDNLTVREVDDLLPRLDFPADGGGMLTENDVGKNTIVLQQGEDFSAVEEMGLSVGDRLGFVGVDDTGFPASGEVELEVVGFSNSFIGDGAVLTATDPFGGQQGVRREAWGLVQVEDDKQDALVRDINLAFDSVFAYETSFFTDFMERLIEHFTLIPLALSGLSLVAAVVIIANAVALSTIERRREIGLLKAVGARSNWVVVQLAVENTFLGFVGGAIGLALSIAVLAVVVLGVGGELSLIISPAIVVGVLALTVVLSLSVTLISAYPAARARPLDVLRGD